jgi:uncharacterized protein (TIGR00369 family)
MQPEQRRSGFRTLVGYRTIAWTDGYAEIELVTGPEHLNSLGFVHGGVYATLLDAALGHAATWVSVQGNVRRSVTLSLTTTYLAPARSGRLVATARLRAIERRVGTLDGEVSDASGKLVAIGQASFRYERGSERTQGVPRR